MLGKKQQQDKKQYIFQVFAVTRKVKSNNKKYYKQQITFFSFTTITGE